MRSTCLILLHLQKSIDNHCSQLTKERSFKMILNPTNVMYRVSLFAISHQYHICIVKCIHFPCQASISNFDYQRERKSFLSKHFCFYLHQTNCCTNETDNCDQERERSFYGTPKIILLSPETLFVRY
jgi:hypothetical protein